MKKAILACDGKNFPKGAFEFIKELQLKEPLFVAGVFLHALNFEMMIPGLFAVTPEPVMEFLKNEHEEYENTIKEFRVLCERNALEYSVHEESKEWKIKDLVKESRFADFIAVSANFFRTDFNTPEPNFPLQQIMRQAECPIMVFPEEFSQTDRVVIAYDGSKSAMCALKEFCRIFPELQDKPVKVVFVKDEDSDEIPDMDFLEEYAGRHFTNLTFEKLRFNTKKFFADWAREQNNMLLVCGSYSHSGIADVFRENFAEEVIRTQSNAVFVSHY